LSEKNNTRFQSPFYGISVIHLKYHLKNIHGIEKKQTGALCKYKFNYFFYMENSPHNVAEKIL